MDIIKKTLPVLVMLLVVVLIWVGLTIYWESSDVEINPNAENYTNQLQTSFDLEDLDTIAEKTEKHFPVGPDVFLSLVEED